MGRRISKEFLHPSILEGVNNKIGNLDSLETDAKGNMVQAINELVEKLDNSAEIENGKELIANAVGEPLTAEDSFDEMSTDINSLLSTFKTNMMNNGITVESGDKFKALIDKIATMAEEGSGKGIQYAEGIYNNTEGDKSITINNLTFKPIAIFVRQSTDTNDKMSLTSSFVYDVNGKSYMYTVYNWAGNENYYSANCNTSDNSFTISITGGYENSLCYWYAFGVGEEDTTLRDSLADILENKGVDVTEEDDMASLITKVDEEFTKSITVVSSDEVFMTQHNFVPTSKPNSYQGNEPIQLFKLIATFNGSITCSTTLRQYNNEYNAYLNINHIRDNVVITTKSYQTTTTLEINCLIENILPGDVIEITGHTTTGLSTESMVLSAPVVLYGSIVK